jgi:hypothetical protein
MNTLPDLSQLTMNNCWNLPAVGNAASSLAQSNQELEKSNQQLDAKVQHLSILAKIRA